MLTVKSNWGQDLGAALRQQVGGHARRIVGNPMPTQVSPEEIQTVQSIGQSLKQLRDKSVDQKFRSAISGVYEALRDALQSFMPSSNRL